MTPAVTGEPSWNAAGFSLYCLGPSYLEAFRGGIAVQRHVLRLEWGRGIAVLAEDPAKSRRDHTLAHIGAGAYKHN